MEANSSEWRPGPTVCRCCLAEGCYKDISTEYFWMGKREVYAEMLAETFDLSIAYSKSGGPNSNSRLICEPCISRLRDAADFKRQVVKCEKTFLHHLDPSASSAAAACLLTDLPGVDDREVKIERVKVERIGSDEEFDDAPNFDMDDDDDLDDQPLTTLASKVSQKSTSVDVLDLMDNAKVAEKRKSTVKVKASPAKKVKIKKDAKASASKAKPEKKKKDSTMEISPNPEVSSNAVTVQVDVHHRHCSQLSASVATTNHVYVNETQATSDVSSIHPGYPKTAAERMREYRARKKKETLTVNHQKQKRSAAERAKQYRIRKKMKIHSGDDEDIEEKYEVVTVKRELIPSDDDYNEITTHDSEYENSDNSIVIVKHELLSNDEKTLSENEINDEAEPHDDRNKTRNNPVQNKNAHPRSYAMLLRKTSLKMIEFSTLCVFQWNKSWYRCFVCQETFPDISLLRQHSETHPLKQIENKIVSQQNRMVKAEISELFCKLCQKRLLHLPELREHLTAAHEIQFDAEDDLLVPFKVEAQNLRCQLCDEPFQNFRTLNVHMNRHYQKHVCHICGATFSNLVFLNLHVSRLHREWRCGDCNVEFSSKAERNRHDQSVHKVVFERKPRFPCPHCEERFYQENFRAQHLVERHGMPKPEYRCKICPKVFITRSLCNNHVKNVHNKEKNQECDVCHDFFYTKSDLARHQVTHTGEKNFTCKSCNSLFASRDSLRRHMKRTHSVQ